MLQGRLKLTIYPGTAVTVYIGRDIERQNTNNRQPQEL
jgi:hypothetical protein